MNIFKMQPNYMITDERRGSLNEDENIDIEETPADE
jgi:hypothetical protein